MNNNLEILKKIKKVEASPFLYTRIEQKINNTQPVLVGKLIYVSALATILIILLVNVTFISSFISHKQKSDTELFVEELHILPKDALCYE